MRAILPCPALGWRQHRKHLSLFIDIVKVSIVSFCYRLTSGSKRNTLAKRGFVASAQWTSEEQQKCLLALKISETAMQSYYVQLNTCDVESTLLSGDRKTKDSCQLLHESSVFPENLIHVYISLAKLGSRVSWAATENAWPGHYPPSPTLFFCVLVTNI